MANLAKSRVRMGDAQNAEQYYRQALTIDPSHQPSYHGLAELMVDQGRTQEAQAMMSTWAATQPYIAESHVELAWLQRETGNSQGAAQSLQQALQVNPNHATALAHMGQYYEEIGQTDEALEMYQNSLRADWNQPEVHSRLAAVSQSAGDDHPMAATAMARGVHPYSLPRQQTAFGPPSPGAQMAQMHMMQTQMAMAGHPMATGPMYGQAMPGMMPNQMAMNSTMMPERMTPGSMTPGMSNGFSQEMHSGWQQSTSPMQMMPTQTASFGTSSPLMGQPSESQSWPMNSTMPSASPFDVPATPATKTAVNPIPDPAFSAMDSAAEPEISTVSFSQPASPTQATGSSDPPLVDAF
jgi:Flp pilus assembly protein TadD